MVRIFFILIFISNYVFAQVLLTERFDNFLFSTDGATSLFNANDTIITDQVGSNNLTVAATSSGKDAINNLISGGFSEHINDNAHYTKAEPTTLDFTGSFFVNVAIWFDAINANQVIFSKNNAAINEVQYFGNFWNSNQALRFGEYDGGNNYRIGTPSQLEDSTWYVFTFVYDSVNTDFNLYKNGVNYDGGLVGTAPAQLTNNDYEVRISGYTSSSSRLKARVAAIRFSSGVADSLDIKEPGFIANGWKSLNGGVTRKNWEFSQGVVSDTIYYASVLTSGNWSITLSDSAASSVNYEVLTSADATTWTTLASGTTSTSWGSKSYSGTGTGYIALAVASGTAFFDDLVVTLEGGKKTKHSGFNGWNKY